MSIKKAVLLSVGIKFLVVIFCVSLVYTNYILGKIWQQIDEVVQAVRTGGDLNMLNKEGRTGLMVAAAQANIELARDLIEAGADLDIKEDSKIGNTALHFACFSGDFPGVIEAIELLVKSGADVTIRNNEGNRALHMVIQIDTLDDRIKITNLLIKHGADINAQGSDDNTMLHLAVITRDIYWVEIMIDRYGSLVDFERKNIGGYTPLAFARKFGFTDIAARLEAIPAIVGSGEDVDERDKNGLTGLMLAVIRDDKDFAQELIDRGADLNAISEDEYENSALHWALIHQNRSMVKMFVDNGADVMQGNAAGNTPIHFVMKMRDDNERKLVTKFLVDTEVSNINVQNHDGNTLLHLVAQKNDLALGDFLVRSYGDIIDFDVTNNRGWTAQRLARRLGYTHMVDILGTPAR